MNGITQMNASVPYVGSTFYACAGIESESTRSIASESRENAYAFDLDALRSWHGV